MKWWIEEEKDLREQEKNLMDILININSTIFNLKKKNNFELILIY